MLEQVGETEPSPSLLSDSAEHVAVNARRGSCLGELAALVGGAGKACLLCRAGGLMVMGMSPLLDDRFKTESTSLL